MTPEQQRTAIAEAIGWKWIGPNGKGCDYNDDIGDREKWFCYECKDGYHARCVGVPCMCPCIPADYAPAPEYEI